MRQTENQEILNRIDKLEAKLTDVEQEVREIRTDTKDLVTTFQSLTGFLNVINFLYNISKPLIWFVFVCAAIYYFMIGIKMPIPKI